MIEIPRARGYLLQAALVVTAAGLLVFPDLPHVKAAPTYAATQPDTAPGPAEPPRWDLLPILPLPAEIPGSGGLKLYDVDEVFVVSGDFFMFWGRIDPKKNQFGLFSYKAAAWSMLFQDGKSILPPFLQGPPTKIGLKREASFSSPTQIVVGPDRFFILTQDKLFSWDGAALRKVWGSLADDPARLQDKYSRVLDVSVDRTGRLLLEVSSHSSTGLVFCDAERILQPLTSKSPFPGRAGATISECERAVLTTDGCLFVSVETRDSAGKKALGIYRRSGTDFEKLLAVGDPHPKAAGKTVENLWLHSACGRDRYLWICNSRLYIVDGDRWNEYGKGAGYSILAPRFPKSNPDLFAFVEHFETPPTLQQYSHTESSHWVCVDLQKGRDILWNSPPPDGDTQLWSYLDEDLSGLLVWDRDKPSKWAFLDFRDPRRGYTQPPAIGVPSGRSFTMANVKSMFAPGRGLVALPDGLYLLKKSAD